jgi:hypothetical protein
VSVGCAYVVSPDEDYAADDPRGFSMFYSDDSDHSVALKPRYNAHFVPVRYCGQVHCVTGRPIPLEYKNSDYQAAVEGVNASKRLSINFRFWCEVFLTHALLLQPRTNWWLCLLSRLCQLQWFG